MQKTQIATATNSQERSEKNAQAAAMLRQWLVEADREDDSQYDWDAIEAELQNSAMSCGNSDPDDSGDA
jgi:hypothetical protein